MPSNPTFKAIDPSSGAYVYEDESGLPYYVEPDDAMNWGLPQPPDFSAPPEAMAMAPTPEPMPDMRLAQSDADKIRGSLGQPMAPPPIATDATSPQIENRAPMLQAADPSAVTPESIDAQQAQFSQQVEQVLGPPPTQASAMPEDTVVLGGPQQGQQQQPPSMAQSAAAGALEDMFSRGGQARLVKGGMTPDARVVKGDPGATSSLIGAQGQLNERQQDANAMRAEVLSNRALEQNKELLLQNVQLGFEQRDAERLAAKRQQELDRRRTMVQTRAEEAAAGKVDPRRLWKEADGMERVGMALMVGLGAFGSALTGTPNTALQIINDQIRLDTEAQANELAAKKELVGELKNELAEWTQENSPEAARMAVEAIKQKQAANQIRVMANQEAREDVKMGMIETANLLDQAYLDKLRDYQKDIEVTESYKYTPDRYVGGRKKMTLQDVKDVQELEGIMSGQVPGDPKNAVNDPLTGKVLGYTPDSTTASKARDAAINSRKLIDNVDRMRMLISQASKMKPQDRQRLQTNYAALMAATNKELGGALDEGNQALLRVRLGDMPSDLTSVTSQSVAAMDETRAATENGIRSTLNGYGIPGDRFNLSINPATQTQLDE